MIRQALNNHMISKVGSTHMRQYVACLLIVLLFCTNATSISATSKGAFTDIEQSYAVDAIKSLSAQGVITGYQDGSFQPKRSISRQEWASVFVKSLNWTSEPGTVLPFQDVSPWAVPYVSALYHHQITNGISATEFGVKRPITRQEIAVWYARYLGLTDRSHDSVSSGFADQAEIADYAKSSVWLMEQLDLMQGDDQHRFLPEQPIQRQAAVLVAYRVLQSGDDLQERAKQLLDKSSKHASTSVADPSSEPQPLLVVEGEQPSSGSNTVDSIDVTPEITGQRANARDKDRNHNNPRPDPELPPVQPPVPSSPVEPSFIFDHVNIEAPVLWNDPATYPSYQLSFHFWYKGAKITLPEKVASDLKYEFKDQLNIFDANGKIVHPEYIPTTGGLIPVSLHIVSKQARLDLKVETMLMVTVKAPPLTPPVEEPQPESKPDNVIRSVYLDTYTIEQAVSLKSDTWRIHCVFQNAYGQNIAPNDLPADLHIRFEDDAQIIDEQGRIINLHNIPVAGTIIPVKVSVISPSTSVYLNTEFDLKVIAGERRKQYFAVSVMLEGGSGSSTTLAEMQQMRSMLARIDPHLHITWAIDNNFVFQESNRPQLQQVLQYVDLYGDEVGILSGYPNNHYTLAQWGNEMNEWLYMYRYNALNALHESGTVGQPSVFASIPLAYRPTSLSSFAVNPEQVTWLKNNFGITSYMGWAATQYNVNNLFGEGSPLMPYWSNEHNPLVPAQGGFDNSGAVFMNPVTIDPIGSRYVEKSSRWTIHPGDPYVQSSTAEPQLYTAQQYVDNPYQMMNTVNYLSIVIDTNWVLRHPNLFNGWDDFVNHFPAGRDVHIVGIDELGQMYRTTSGSTNDHAQFTLMFRGSGYVTAIDGNNSPADTRYLWTENEFQRLILRKQDGDSAWSVIDFTDYTKMPVPQTPYAFDSHTEVSYVTGRNYKIAPGAPLTAAEIQRIQERLQQIHFTEDVDYQ